MAAFIRVLRTNMRAGKGRGLELEIGQRTLIVADNGVGKSRWQNAAEASLTSTVDDIWLRRMTKTADLMVLLPPGEDRLYATAVFEGVTATAGVPPSQATAHYEFAIEKGKAKGAKPERPAWVESLGDWVLPVREVYTALSAGPDKARTFFLPFMAPTDDANEIERRVPPEYLEPAENGGRKPSSITELLAFVELSSTRVSEERNNADASEKLAESLRTAVQSPDPSNDALNGARRLVLAYQRIAERMAAEDAAGAATHAAVVAQAEADRLRQQEAGREAQRAADLKVVDAEIASFDQWLGWADANLDTMAPDPGPLPPVTAVWQQVFITGKAHAEVMVHALGHGITDRCHGCGGPVTAAALQASVIPYLDQQMKALQDTISGWEQKRAYRATCQQQIVDTRRTRDGKAAHRTMLAGLPLGVTLPQGSMTPVPAPLPPPPEAEVIPLPPGSAMPTNIVEARRMLQTAEEGERQALSLREKWVSIRDADNRGREGRRLQKWWKEYGEALKKVVGELLDSGVSNFQAKAQRYMPSKWKLYIQLRDGEREVFRLGLVDNGAVNMAPSGAQLASAAIAMAMACLESKVGGPPPYALITLPEERDWDGKTLAAVMRALSECPYQILLTSTTEPAGRKPAGWTIINLKDEDDDKKKGPQEKSEKSEKPEDTTAALVPASDANASGGPTPPPVSVPPGGPPPNPGGVPPNPLVAMGRTLTE